MLMTDIFCADDEITPNHLNFSVFNPALKLKEDRVLMKYPRYKKNKMDILQIDEVDEQFLYELKDDH